MPVGEEDKHFRCHLAAPEVMRIIIEKGAFHAFEVLAVLQLPVRFQKGKHGLASVQFLSMVRQVMKVHFV